LGNTQRQLPLSTVHCQSTIINENLAFSSKGNDSTQESRIKSKLITQMKEGSVVCGGVQVVCVVTNNGIFNVILFGMQTRAGMSLCPH